MKSESRIYRTETKRKTVNYKNTPVMAVNLRYPVFEAQNASKTEYAFVAKINKFYADSAEKYLHYLGGRYAGKAAKIYNSNGGIKISFVMNCAVTYSDANYVSVFVDISSFDGNKTKAYRFSQLWSAEKSAILTPSKIFDTGIRSKSYVKEIITEIAEKNMRLKDFSYFDNYKSIINKRFDFSKFYIVPNGVAFYFDKGILSSVPDVCVFVIPFDRIDGLTKMTFVNS